MKIPVGIFVVKAGHSPVRENPPRKNAFHPFKPILLIASLSTGVNGYVFCA
jgi:hypothetical protein